MKIHFILILILITNVSCTLSSTHSLDDHPTVHIEKTKDKAIIILYSHIGNGHISAAQAIKNNIEQKSPNTQVILKNIRSFIKPKFGSKKFADYVDKESYMFVFNHLPNLYSTIYETTMREGVLEQQPELASLDINALELIEFIKKISNKIPVTDVVSTHYMGAKALGSIRNHGIFTHSIRLSWVMTDYLVGYFPRISQYLDMTFLPHKSIKDIWIKRGVPQEKVMVSGIPTLDLTSENFPSNTTDLKDQNQIKKDYTITLSTGGDGLGDYYEIIQSLIKEFKDSGKKICLFAFPARSKNNLEKLKIIQNELPKNFTLFFKDGFVDKSEIINKIKISDLYITKAGGLSPSEAIFLNIPLLLINRFGGHEKENASFYEHINLAVLANRYQDIGRKSKLILTNKIMRDDMMKAQKDFISNLKPTLISDFLIREKPAEILKNRPAQIISQGNKALHELENTFTSPLEILLSYTQVENESISNPFGHLAIRIHDTVYTTDADSRKNNRKYLLAPLSLKEYLFSRKNKLKESDFTHVHGQLWGRSVLSLRIKDINNKTLDKMLHKIDEINVAFNKEALEFHNFKYNCAIHIQEILAAGGYKVFDIKQKKPILPLEVFTNILDYFEEHNFEQKLVFYQQINTKNINDKNHLRYDKSVGPIMGNLYYVLNWWLFSKHPPEKIALESYADYRLSFYPEGRFVFEDIKSYHNNEFIDKTKNSKKTVIIPTFDDGPLNRTIWSSHAVKCPSRDQFLQPLKDILSTLKKRNTKAIFYINSWKNVDLDPNCKTRTEEELKSIFYEGIDLIIKEKHGIAPHSYDHLSFKNKNLTEEDILNDIQQLLQLFKAKNIPYLNIWRPPYGQFNESKLRISKKLGLHPKRWILDSFDYLDHDDSSGKIIFKNKWLWDTATKVGLAYSSKINLSDKELENIDILFHVNENTSKNLTMLLNRVEFYIKKNTHDYVFTKKKFIWLSDIHNEELSSYLN